MKQLSLTVTVEEANVILEALGNLPFSKVFALIGKLQGQARQQLSDNNGSGATGGPDRQPSSVEE